MDDACISEEGLDVGTLPLAVLGGERALSENVPITRPTLPPYEELAPLFRRVIESGMITKSIYLEELETRVGTAVGAQCLGVSSCTVGLVMALQALRLDGEVILPSFTFLATASAPALIGLPLRFVDIDRHGWTISPDAVEAAISPRTAAVIAVHTFGAPAHMDRLEAICRKRGLALVVDAAHGLGSLRGGKPVGAGGDVEVFSMSPTKLVAAGEGGLVTTTDTDLAQRIETLREYGNRGDYVTVQAGLNGRLDELSAILALAGYRSLETNAGKRNRLAQIARDSLRDTLGLEWQRVREGDRSSFKDLTVAVEPSEFGLDRDKLAMVLKAEGVDTRKYYSPLVHKHPAFAGAAVDPLPVSEWLETRALSLPLFSHMSEEIMRTIARLVAAAQLNAREITGMTRAAEAKVG